MIQKFPYENNAYYFAVHISIAKILINRTIKVLVEKKICNEKDFQIMKDYQQK